MSLPTPPIRLDVWLDVACLCRTRSEAQAAIKGGKVNVNGHAAKPHKEVKPGDIVEMTRPLGRRQRVQVMATAGRHIPKADAKALYTDITPPPTPEEQAMLDLLRIARPRHRPPAHAPGRDERRRLRREKEGEPG